MKNKHGQLKNVRTESKKLKDGHSRRRSYCRTPPSVINLIWIFFHRRKMGKVPGNRKWLLWQTQLSLTPTCPSQSSQLHVSPLDVPRSEPFKLCTLTGNAWLDITSTTRATPNERTEMLPVIRVKEVVQPCRRAWRSNKYTLDLIPSTTDNAFSSLLSLDTSCF